MWYPMHQSGILINESLDIKVTYKDLIIPRDELEFENSKKVKMMRLTHPRVGFKFDMTTRKTIEVFILGLGDRQIRCNINRSNLGLSTVNGRIFKRALEFRSNLISKLTPEEIYIYKILESREFKKLIYPLRRDIEKNRIGAFYLNLVQPVYPTQDSFYIPDFTIFGLQNPVAIELDGYYHFTKEGAEYDQTRDSELRSLYGLRTLRYSNSKALSLTAEELEFDIRSILSKSSYSCISNSVSRIFEFNNIDNIFDLQRAVKSAGDFNYAIATIKGNYVELEAVMCGNLKSCDYPMLKDITDGKFKFHHSLLDSLISTS